MYTVARSALFALDPEAAHHLAMTGLATLGALPGAIRPCVGRARTVMGLEFRNPVGLAAGLDKDAIAVTGLARIGFGFVEIGTVTPRPQPGNEKPRLFRAASQEGLINRMGFNNDGLPGVVPRLRALRRSGRLVHTRLGVNIGKNKVTDNSAAGADYAAGFDAVSPFADYVTVNLSSPNTPGLRDLQAGAALAALLEPLKVQQGELANRDGKYTPLALKIAPDLTPEEVREIAAIARDLALDALIATNTTITRPGIPEPLAAQAGGLSGKPLFELSRATVARFADTLGETLPVIAVGGISSAADGRAMLDAGAQLLQIYTGFIYRGPALVSQLARL